MKLNFQDMSILIEKSRAPSVRTVALLFQIMF